jgi:hypothetical protein
VPDHQIVIVPHGVDVSTSDGPKTAYRRAGNSGYLLLRAFAAVAEKRPDARLLLKGVDDVYRSNCCRR